MNMHPDKHTSWATGQWGALAGIITLEKISG